MVWTAKFIRCIVNSFSILVSDLWFKYANTTPPPLAVFGEGGKTIGKWREFADEWNGCVAACRAPFTLPDFASLVGPPFAAHKEGEKISVNLMELPNAIRFVANSYLYTQTTSLWKNYFYIQAAY